MSFCTKKVRVAVVALLLLLPLSSLLAKEFSHSFQEKLIDNLVTISVWDKAQSSDVPAALGMGFIVGASGGQYYVVTTLHTFRGMEDGAVIKVRVHNGSEVLEYLAQLMNFSGSDIMWAKNLDMAYLKFSSERRLPFEKAVLAANSQLEPGSVVRVVGDYNPREQVMWHVSPQTMIVNSVYSELGRKTIAFGADEVKNGVSGAPLISAEGIVGMVISWDQHHNNAVVIDELQELIQSTDRVWQLTTAEQVGAASSENEQPREIESSVRLQQPAAVVQGVKFVPDSETKFLSTAFNDLLNLHNLKYTEDPSRALKVITTNSGLFRDEEFGEVILLGEVSVKIMHPDGATLHRESLSIEGRSLQSLRQAADRAAVNFSNQFESSDSMRMLENLM